MIEWNDIPNPQAPSKERSLWDAFLHYLYCRFIGITTADRPIIARALLLTWFVTTAVILIPAGFIVGLVGGTVWFLWDTIRDAVERHTYR
jgi:hypothetical protein